MSTREPEEVARGRRSVAFEFPVDVQSSQLRTCQGVVPTESGVVLKPGQATLSAWLPENRSGVRIEMAVRFPEPRPSLRQFLWCVPGFRDLNDDGRPDLVLGNYPVSGSQHQARAASLIAYGTSKRGAYECKEFLTEGARGISAGDLNGDDVLDLVVSNARGNRSRVYWGPEFAWSDSLALPTHLAQGNAIADFDQDGNWDVLFSTFQPGHHTGSRLFYGDGSGGFPRQGGIPFTSSCEAVSVWDRDQDGVLDIVFSFFGARGAGAGSAVIGGAIREGLWSPEYSRSAVLPTEGSLGVVSADLDEDGEIDVVFTEPKRDRISIWYSGRPDLDPQFLTFPEKSFPFTVAAADLDVDGCTDLLVSARYAPHFTVFWGDGSRGFLRDTTTFPANQPKSAAVGDLDVDGWPDLVIHNGGPRDGEPQRSTADIHYSRGQGRQFDGPYSLDVRSSDLGLGTTIVGSPFPGADNAYGDQPCSSNAVECFVVAEEVILLCHDRRGGAHRLALPVPQSTGPHEVCASWDAHRVEFQVGDQSQEMTLPCKRDPWVLPYIDLGTDREHRQTFRGVLESVTIEGRDSF